MITDSIKRRFLSRVKKTPTCWLWTGSLRGHTRNGISYWYGQMWVNGRQIGAHRVSYEVFKKVNPGKFFVCHKCDNPQCVKPGHLFLGTNSDNILDAVKKGRNPNANKKKCKNGHLFKGRNLVFLSNGQRRCRACNLESVKQHYKRKTA